MHVAGVASGIARVKAKLEPVVKKKDRKKNSTNALPIHSVPGFIVCDQALSTPPRPKRGCSQATSFCVPATITLPAHEYNRYERTLETI